MIKTFIRIALATTIPVSTGFAHENPVKHPQ